MIQFGVMANTHPAPGADLTRMVDEVIAEAQQAERVGFDSFFLTEHHQEPSGYFPSFASGPASPSCLCTTRRGWPRTARSSTSSPRGA
jgi:alkanesulfonate monooxygenase SsuD/methylene tetrahydromethanopterin reductase-like flavin-dependent oxidoreductase (luciferase family)